GLVIRQVWSGEDVTPMSAPSPDGRYLAYTDWTTKGNLAIRDLKLGESRTLTKEDGYVESAVFLPDGKRIIYGWNSYATQLLDVRMIHIDGTNAVKIMDDSFVPVSVSPDGKLVGGFRYGDGIRQLTILDLTTKKLARLKSIGWTTPAVGSFS